METMPIRVLECRENSRYCARDEIILLTFDNNIIEPTLNLMHSIRQHNDRRISFACMVHQLSEESKEKLLSADFGVKLYLCEFAVELDSRQWPIVTFFSAPVPLGVGAGDPAGAVSGFRHFVQRRFNRPVRSGGTGYRHGQ